MPRLVAQAEKIACYTIYGDVVAHVDSKREGESRENVKGKVPRSNNEPKTFREPHLDLQPRSPRQLPEHILPDRARKLEWHLRYRWPRMVIDHCLGEVKNRCQQEAQNC